MLRVLEWYCGIGGCAAALPASARVVAAVDISQPALGVYRHNFNHPTHVRAIESLESKQVEDWAADLWWLSPPCQPHTRRGLRRDLEDRRALSFLRLLELLPQLRPRYVALENVPEFSRSRARRRLLDVLAGAGYRWLERQLCPTELGVPNRRRRYYLVASREALAPWLAPPLRPLRLSGVLESRPDPSLLVDPQVAARYASALDIVDANDPDACCACFTAAYGRSPVRSGSYLRTADGLRRFAPEEILRLLGFPATYTLPDDLPRRKAWSLVGNSVSVTAVTVILSAIPELAANERVA